MSLAMFAMIQELKREIAELKAHVNDLHAISLHERICALENKRGPGRPPKQEEAA